MKRFLRLFLCAAVMMSVICMTVAAETPVFKLDMGDGYLYFREGDDLSRAEKITGTDKDELQKLFDEENLVMLALSEDNLRQIRVSRYTNDLSIKIGDLDLLDNGEVKKIRDELSDDLGLGGTLVGDDYTENTEAPVKKYIIHRELFSDSGGDYNVTQYVTVVDGAFWHITTYGPNHSDVPNVIPHFSVGAESFDWSVVWRVVGVLFGVFAIVVLVLYLRESKAEKKIEEGFEENEKKDF